ncbi:MAG: hypothetical protein JWM10_1784 [Myxococcaceae bacterium]|nr:hypothetical protein [Myxococcaceae bacterium]
MRRRTALRAPFVLTLAATALGCGASVTPAPGDGGVSSDEPTTDRPVVETDAHRACPSTLPAVGSPCTPVVDPETCTDPGRSPPGCPSGVGVTVRCDPATQRWIELPTFCNPPPPVQCPAERPEAGAPCPPGSYLTTPLSCGYDLCGERNATEATCAGPGGVWSVQRSSCNPPAPVCPVEMPAPDSACALPPIGCEWGDCDGRSTARGTCVSGRWSIAIAECVLDAGAPADI